MLGASDSTMPILKTGKELVQGSDKIIDWADANSRNDTGALTPKTDKETCLEIERRLDQISGVHVRRFYYSDALFNNSNDVKNMFAGNVSMLKGLLVSATWGFVRNALVKALDLGPEQGEESRLVIENELEWIEGILSDGREYLVGDRFSRADLTAASLLAPLVLPEQHPVYPSVRMPKRYQAQLEKWKDRPSINWVREIYSRHRRA